MQGETPTGTTKRLRPEGSTTMERVRPPKKPWDSRAPRIYRVIQEELPPLMELISEDILSKKCHINLGPILNIYRVTFIRNWNFSKF
jgi:hypothetical protein